MASSATTVDVDTAAAKRLAYNMYRGMLGNFHEQANVIVDTLPRGASVRQDQGVAKQIESMLRQSSELSGGLNNAGADKMSGPPPPPPMPSSVMSGGAPPPPPPPPPAPGMPGTRLNSEIGGGSRLAPPAAIQAAMIGKDKKPFTYTPGGIDLSEIRSPRMQRRICRNAAAEGVCAVAPPPPTTAPTAAPVLPASARAAMQAQLAVAVLPPPQPPQLPRAPVPQAVNKPAPAQCAPTTIVQEQPPVNMHNNDTRKTPTSVYIPHTVPNVVAFNSQQPLQAGHIYVAPLSSKVDSGSCGQLGSLYIPPVQSPPTPESHGSASPLHANLNKTSMPWLNSQSRSQHGSSPASPASPAASAGVWSPPSTPPTSTTRIIPIQVEGRESQAASRTRIVPISVEGGAPTPTPQHQQPPRRPAPLYTHNKFAGPGHEQNNVSHSPLPQTPQTPQSAGGVTPPVQSRSFRVLQRITASEDDPGQTGPQAAPVSQTGPPPPPPAVMQQQQQQQQQRKLQMSNEDRQLMDRFKAQDAGQQPSQQQEAPEVALYRGASIPSRVFRLLEQSVDDDTFLHSEPDPRYRGAAIPSRAFRMLQTMTEGGPPIGVAAQPLVPAGGSAPPMHHMVHHAPPSGSSVLGEPISGRLDASSPQQTYVPASEQGAQPEPRKYTGSCIPSRSFRMLQAMTSPEDCESTEVSDVTPEAMYYAPPSPCPSPYSWYYPTEGGSGDPVWDSYIYAYMSNYGHCPPGYYYPPPNNNYESDEYSGYSSTEEMAYYGQQQHTQTQQQQQQAQAFAAAQVHHQQQQAAQVLQTAQNKHSKEAIPEGVQQQANTSDEEEEDEADSNSDSDSDSATEVEESEDEHKSSRSSGSGLHAIKSVPDIHASSQLQLDVADDDSECGSDVDEGDSESGARLGAKQLSVIYEESEHSDAESVRRLRWRAANTPALTETEEEEEEEEEESSDADEPPKQPQANSSDNKLSCDTKLWDTDVSDEEENSKLTYKLGLQDPNTLDDDCEVESEGDTESAKTGDEDGELSDEVDCERDRSSTRSQSTCDDESEEDSEQHSSKNTEPVLRDDKTHSSSKLTNNNNDEESSEEENERNSGKLQTSSTVVEINKANAEKTSIESSSGDDEPEATVTVRLPLRLKFSRNSSTEAVTTLIVGDSEQVPRCKLQTSPPSSAAKVEEWMQRGEHESKRKASEDAEVSVCLSLPLRRNPVLPAEAEDSHWEDDSSSTSIQTVRPRCASVASIATVATVASFPESQEADTPSNTANDDHQEHVSSVATTEKHEKKAKTKEKSSQLSEKRTKRTIRRSSTEDDSGVTDLSRQISDSESEVGAELLACQRAATHSRLFKLLQDACGCEEEDDETTAPCKPLPRRELLHLPLRCEARAELDSSSLSSSGITSPASPTVAARLVRELAKELSRRKGKRQRPARLHAAAMRIMKEEDNDPYDTTTGSSASSDSGGARPSPLQPHSATLNSGLNTAAPTHPAAAYFPPYLPQPPPHLLATYGPNYYEYLDYYNSWGSMDPRDYGVVPARAFRVLSNPGASALDAPYAKCPRIVSHPSASSSPRLSQMSPPCSQASAPTPAS